MYNPDDETQIRQLHESAVQQSVNSESRKPLPPYLPYENRDTKELVFDQETGLVHNFCEPTEDFELSLFYVDPKKRVLPDGSFALSVVVSNEQAWFIFDKLDLVIDASSNIYSAANDPNRLLGRVGEFQLQGACEEIATQYLGKRYF